MLVFVPMTMSVTWVDPENKLGGIFPETVIEAGNPAKALDPIEVMDGDSIVILLNNEHFLNAESPMNLMFAGIIIDVS